MIWVTHDENRKRYCPATQTRQGRAERVSIHHKRKGRRRVVQTATKGVLPENRDRHREDGAKAGNKDLATNGTEPKGRPVLFLRQFFEFSKKNVIFTQNEQV